MGPEIITPKEFRDSRGIFYEVFNMSKKPWNHMHFQQQNVSINHRNVFRGLHYQYENPQGKLVRVLAGVVFDYIVDLRKWSKDFGRVRRFRLEADNTMLWVPEGFAHGFLVLEPETIFTYNVFGAPYTKEDEYSIDPYQFELIAQDLSNYENTHGYPILLSDKDKAGLALKDAPVYQIDYA